MKLTRSRIYLTLPFIVLLAACATSTPVKDGSPEDRKDLKGRSLAQVFAMLGSSTILDDVMPASELGGEFYTPVNARFPIDDPRSRKVLIREVRWQRGDHYIAVLCVKRMGDWQVFDAVEWHKDLRF